MLVCFNCLKHTYELVSGVFKAREYKFNDFALLITKLKKIDSIFSADLMVSTLL